MEREGKEIGSGRGRLQSCVQQCELDNAVNDLSLERGEEMH